jgi:hypothetical protein
MGDCNKHKKVVEKYTGSLEELAEDIGNLHYESLRDFLLALSIKVYEDSKKDEKAGRTKLAHHLYETSSALVSATRKSEMAWKISEPYMKEDNQEEPVKENLWDNLAWKFRSSGMTFNNADDLIEELKSVYHLIEK